MTLRMRLKTACLVLVGVAAPVFAQARSVADYFPENTMLYIAWPGIEALGEAASGTEMAALLKEREVLRFREAWSREILPAVDALVKQTGAGPDDYEHYLAVRGVLDHLWRHPVSIGLIDMGISPMGPAPEIGLVVRAGDEAAALQQKLERSLEADEIPFSIADAKEATVAGAKMKQVPLMGPMVPLAWGVFGEDLLITVGTRATGHLVAGDDSIGLGRSERFSEAMRITGASAASPTLYLNLRAIIDTLAKYQPLFAQQRIPVLGDPNGVQKLLDAMGLGSLQSLSLAMSPEGKGFKTTMFVHAPGVAEGLIGSMVPKVISSGDLVVVPRDVRWASASNIDLGGTYTRIVELIGRLSPETKPAIDDAIGRVEQMMGFKIGEDLLGAFGDTWVTYDAPAAGGIWISGMTFVVDVKPGHKLDTVLPGLVSAVNGFLAGREHGEDFALAIIEEEYRGHVIRHMTCRGLPIPVAPAWAEHEGRLVIALFPQMARFALDHQIDKGPTLLDNQDFVQARKHVPEDVYAISYVDSKSGTRQLYSWLLPLSQMGFGMLQGQDIPVDISMLPSAETIARHVSGSVGGSALTPDGWISVSYGSTPLAMPALGEGGAMVPLMVSITLPSLARAREMAKRTVSAANLRQVGVSSYTYAIEHQGKFPDNIWVLLEEGGLVAETLRSPLEVDEDARCSYIYIGGQSDTGDPTCVLAYEKPVNHDHEGTNVLYLDSHVEWVKMDRLRRDLERTYERLGREMPDDLDVQPGGGRGTSGGQSEVQNLRAIAIACLLYAEAHQGKLPPDLKTLAQGEKKFLGETALVSPNDRTGAGCSYLYVEGQTHVMDPRNVVVYVKPDLTDGQRIDVAFLDGHCRRMTIAEFENELKATGDRLGRELMLELPGRDHPEARARIEAVRAMVDKSGPLAAAVTRYKLDVGGYPSELSDLARKPADEKLAERWAGPYIKDIGKCSDPWGRPLRFEYDPDQSETTYRLWSVGPDGIDGTDDDIGNWMKN